MTRATGRGRAVYSRGPIIRSLEILSAISGLVAIGALVLALTVFSGRLDSIQTSRFDSLLTQCQDVRARHEQTVTTLKQQQQGPAARALIGREARLLGASPQALVELAKLSQAGTIRLIDALVPARRDCAAYAHRLVKLPPTGH